MEHTARTKALSWLLSLALMLSLAPGMGLTAYANGEKAYAAYVPTENDDADALAAKVVKFNGMDWYLVEDNSTSEAEGNVTLLNADNKFGLSAFSDDNDNDSYSSSKIKTALDAMTQEGGAFAAVKDAIADTDLADVSVTGAKLYLLSKTEADSLPGNVRKYVRSWWLRGPAQFGQPRVVIGNDGSGGSNNANTQNGVRPALKLDLSKVTFDSGTKTFALAATSPAHTHNDITFTEWTSNNSLPTEAGSYYLTSDVTLSGTWTVPSGNTNLCLNGKTVAGIFSDGSKAVIKVDNSSTLNLYDDGEGKIISKDYEQGSNPISVAVVDCSGTFIMNGGTLSSIEEKELTQGVTLAGGGSFTMNGGTIESVFRGVSVWNSTNQFTMNSGTIRNCKVYGVSNDGSFTMTGGTITGNYNGVCVDEGGVVYLSGAPEISKNGSNEKNVNLMIYSGAVQVAGPLTNTTPIGVTIEKQVQISEFITNYVYTGTFTSGSTDSLKAKDYAAKFTSDNAAYSVAADGNELKLAQAPVAYMAWDETSNTVKNVAGGCTDFTVVTDSTTTWSAGWYVVNRDVTINSVVEFSGEVNLILCDNATLTINGGNDVGIYHSYDGLATLAVYAQSTGDNMGSLTVTSNGSNSIQVLESSSSVTINGGKVSADGKYNGIQVSSNLTINGGSVTATGGNSAIMVTGAGAITVNGGSVTATSGKNAIMIIEQSGAVTVNGGTVTATGGDDSNENKDGGRGVNGNVTVSGGTFTATGGIGGWQGGAGVKGNVTVSGGTVNVAGGNTTSDREGGKGIDGNVTVTGGEVTATGGTRSSGYNKAISGTIQGTAEESDDGTAWTAVSGTTSDKRYVKVYSAHTHSFTYSATGATITATCSNHQDCPLESNEYKVTLTIVKPTLTTYGQNGEGVSAEATITDTNSIQGSAAIRYYEATKDDETYTKDADASALETAPTNAGDYIAEITLGEGENAATAAVGYTIAKATIKGVAVTMGNYTYGGTIPEPHIAAIDGQDNNYELVEANIDSNAADVTYYLNPTAFLRSDNSEKGITRGSQDLTATTFDAGKHYIRAVITGRNFEKYVSEQVPFTVAKADQAAPAAPTVNGTTVTVAQADRNAALEYSLDNTTWVPVTLSENGTFAIDWPTVVTGATLSLRKAETTNYNASAAVNADGTITTTTYTVSFDSDGGSAVESQAIAHNGKAVKPTDPTRVGYTFSGWYNNSSEYNFNSEVSSALTLKAHWTPNGYTVKFNANGGTGTVADQIFAYGTPQALRANAFTRTNYTFIGWATRENGSVVYGDQQQVNNLTAAQNGTVSLYAVWAQSVYTLSGTVTSSNNGTVTLTLKRGGAAFATQNVAVTGSEAAYSFASVPAGDYNLVAEQTVSSRKLSTSKDIMVSGTQSGIDITMPSGEDNGDAGSELDVKGSETPAVVVKGLAAEAAGQAVENRSITVKMEVEAQSEETAGAETQNAIEKIKEQSTGTDGVEFLNISITKEIYKANTKESDEPITVTANLIDIIIPFDTAQRTITIYRYHDENVDTLTTTANSAGESITVSDAGVILHVKKFSTYAIGYTEATTPTYSTGGGAATYAVMLNPAQNGSVSASHKSAASGAKVTITVEPNAGYTVDTVTVTDANGKSVSVTKASDTTYTFTMPSSKVTVNATFTNGACPQDATCPVSKFTDADAKAWYHDGVHWALENGVMQGVSPKYFSPNGDTTRAMVVTMLWRMEGSPAYAGASEFTDVDADTWYTEAVRWASTEGIVTGYENPDDAGMIFNPNGAVTREQLATMLYRYAQYKKADVSASASLSSYGDAQTVSGWATSAMQWAVGSGIVNGIDGNLVPAGNATRAQVATMLMRYSTEK